MPGRQFQIMLLIAGKADVERVEVNLTNVESRASFVSLASLAQGTACGTQLADHLRETGCEAGRKARAASEIAYLM